MMMPMKTSLGGGVYTNRPTTAVRLPDLVTMKRLLDRGVVGAAVALSCCCFSSCANAMILSSRHFPHRRRLAESSQYFAVQQKLPPLTRHLATFINMTETLPYSQHGESLPVTYTNDPKIVAQWLADELPYSSGILGFDVESVPDCPWVKKRASFRGPATVQLATTESCLVVHLTKQNGRLPSRACASVLEAVLSDASIIKAGTGIDQDLLELFDAWNGLQAHARLELGGIGSATSKDTIGLQTLTKSIVGVNLEKSKKVSVSDWSQVPLTQEQLRYASRDAWAGAAIVAELAKRDPVTFGRDTLVQLVCESERSLADLNRDAKRRKNAKMQLRETLKPYHLPHEKRNMPTKVRVKVEKLKRVLDVTRRGGPSMVFNVEPLGFTIESKNHVNSK